MNVQAHTMGDLFAQLGLPSDDESIDSFIKTHGPLPHSMILSDAPFWTQSQAAFLRDEVLIDADWAEVVDQLNVVLHAPAEA